jgi:hypothetical protein
MDTPNQIQARKGAEVGTPIAAYEFCSWLTNNKKDMKS